jgi:hypothetical protein
MCEVELPKKRGGGLKLIWSMCAEIGYTFTTSLLDYLLLKNQNELNVFRVVLKAKKK